MSLMRQLSAGARTLFPQGDGEDDLDDEVSAYLQLAARDRMRRLSAGARTLFHKDDVEHDLDDEVSHYLELATREHMRRGLSRREAERAARMQFGGVEAAKETVRGGLWESAVETLGQDIRYAL